MNAERKATMGRRGFLRALGVGAADAPSPEPVLELNGGSPTWARTRDLRIDMASVVKRAQQLLPFEAS